MSCFGVVYGAHHYFGHDDDTFTTVQVAISSDNHIDKCTVTITVRLISYLFAVDDV